MITTKRTRPTAADRLRAVEQRIARIEAGPLVPTDAAEVMARIAATQPVTPDEQARHRAEALADMSGPRRYTSLDPAEVLRLKPDDAVVDLVAVGRALDGVPTEGLTRDDRRLVIAAASSLGLERQTVADGLGITRKAVDLAIARYRRDVREALA